MLRTAAARSASLDGLGGREAASGRFKVSNRPLVKTDAGASLPRVSREAFAIGSIRSGKAEIFFEIIFLHCFLDAHE
jgi:hypothetical protein